MGVLLAVVVAEAAVVPLAADHVIAAAPAFLMVVLKIWEKCTR